MHNLCPAPRKAFANRALTNLSWQEGAVGVLPGQVAVLRVHVRGAEPRGPAEEGKDAAQD
jgi:hypothetical protein